MRGHVRSIRSPLLGMCFPPLSISFSLKSWKRTVINKYVWPRQMEKDYCISNQFKMRAEQLSLGSSARPGFYRSEALQQSAVPRSFKNERQAELFGKGVSARLATSEILPFRRRKVRILQELSVSLQVTGSKTEKDSY